RTSDCSQTLPTCRAPPAAPIPSAGRTQSRTVPPPLHRLRDSPHVGRECPSSEDLRLAFCQQSARTQHRSDGTISLAGIRFEIPARFRHLPRIQLRYASWDLRYVYLVDPRTATVLARLYPLDRARHADGF